MVLAIRLPRAASTSLVPEIPVALVVQSRCTFPITLSSPYQATEISGRRAGSSVPALSGSSSELLGCERHADLRADHFAGDHDFHSPILLPALCGVIGGHRLGFSEAFRSDRRRRHSRLCQVVAYRRSALFGKMLIIVIPTHAVGETLHVEL